MQFVVAILLMSSAELLQTSERMWSTYFDLGPTLVQEFSGTYEFKYKRVEFVRLDGSTYAVKSSGDQSPSEDKLRVDHGHVYWTLGWSGEQWLVFRNPVQQGAEWRHAMRGWNQRYRVTNADLTVSVPAGQFAHCVEVTISWVAHKHDLQGPQKKVVFLAPHLGIIKQEHWSGAVKEHEEVLTTYATGAGR